jgi:ParB family transcriptional regulator, chromosome partitioning protein
LCLGGSPAPEPEGEPDSPPPPTRPEVPPRRPADPAFLELEQLLGDHLDTRVSISGGGAGKGRLTVEFADIADLERIYRRMTGA